MKIFITGTESFVGKELIKELDKLDYDLFGCDNGKISDKRFINADIRSEDLGDKINSNIDIIIHLAALSSDPLCKGNEYSCFDINVMGTLNMMRFAMEKNCQKFIFASSEWVYENIDNDHYLNEDTIINPVRLKSEYALSKLVSEINIKQKYDTNFCEVAILRFGIIYGSRKIGTAIESIFSKIYNDEELSIGSSDTGRCFIHVDDIVQGIISSINLNGFNVLNIVGDEFITLADIIEVCDKIVKKNTEYLVLNSGNIDQRKISNNLAKVKMGWSPKVDLSHGISLLNKYYNSL